MRLAWVAAVLFAVAACEAIIGLEDARPLDQASLEGGAGSSSGSDGSIQLLPDGAPIPPTVYGDLKDRSRWSAFDLAGVVDEGEEGSEVLGGYGGGTYDGRYVYYAPYKDGASGWITRYDTQRPFSEALSWQAFDTSTLPVAAAGFMGAAFVKGGVYFVPYHRSGSGNVGTMTRHTPSPDLDAGSSWTVFDVSGLPNGPKGFHGAAFDGRYIYYVPAVSSLVARYDTQTPFDAGTSWSTFDVKVLDPKAVGFAGAVFDGRYVYLSPNNQGGPGSAHGRAVRFDTQGTFISSASWELFDISSLNANAKGFFGNAFDGRYVYYAPSLDDAVNAIVMRFDTKEAFTSASAWLPFSLSAVDVNAKAFQGTAFDGRYVYLIPSRTSNALLTRYDTQAPFAEASAWSTFDPLAVDGGAAGFRGAVFDGRFLYLVPQTGTITMRFEAKTPAALPPGQTGSFL